MKLGYKVFVLDEVVVALQWFCLTFSSVLFLSAFEGYDLFGEPQVGSGLSIFSSPLSAFGLFLLLVGLRSKLWSKDEYKDLFETTLVNEFLVGVAWCTFSVLALLAVSCYYGYRFLGLQRVDISLIELVFVLVLLVLFQLNVFYLTRRDKYNRVRLSSYV